MGFTEVYLIGMDFSYIIPESHKRTGDVLLSDTDDPNHFHKDYFGKGKTWKDPKLDRVMMNYKQAKFVYECAGRNIYNATIGGKLELFERVNFNALFSHQVKSDSVLDLTFEPNKSSAQSKKAPVTVSNLESKVRDVTNNKAVGTIIGADRLSNLINTLRSLDLPASSGHLIRFDDARTNSNCIDLFSLKCIQILPPFKVNNLRICDSNSELVRASHRNLVRTDWQINPSDLHLSLRACGFKFSAFKFDLGTTYTLESLQSCGSWSQILKFRVRKSNNKVFIDHENPISKISSVRDGGNETYFNLYNENTWFPKSRFSLSGWCFHRENGNLKQLRLVFSDRTICTLSTLLASNELSNFFASDSRFQNSGFQSMKGDLMKPGHCFLQGFGKTKGNRGEWFTIASLYISKNLFGNKIKVVTQY